MTTTCEITELQVSAILAPHEVRDNAKFEAIKESMMANGWQGAPIVVIQNVDMYQALTGSHRIAAAEAANLQYIPCVIASRELLDENEYDLSDLYETEATWRILDEIGDTDAAALMLEELNKEIGQ